MLQKPRSPTSSSSNSSMTLRSSGCKIASWLSSGLYTAFFVSLDRCSCVKLDTIDALEPRQQPLLFQHRHRSSSRSRSGSSSAVTVRSKPSRRSAVALHQRRPMDDDDDDEDNNHSNCRDEDDRENSASFLPSLSSSCA